MLINKKELLEKLERVKYATSNKEIIEFADSFYFSKSKIIAYNDFVCVQTPIKTGIKGTIKAEIFYKTIRQFKETESGEIEIEPKETEILIKNKKASCGIPLNISGKLNLDELNQNVENWEAIPGEFQEGIHLASFCASKDASNPKITCIHINENKIESSDGQRAFRFKIKQKIKTPFLLPAFVCPFLKSQNLEKYNIAKNWIHFKTISNDIISCRMYQDIEYPDINSFFSNKGDPISLHKNLKTAIDKAVIFMPEAEEEKTIEVSIEKKFIIIKAKSENGWYREKIANKSDIQTSFEINPFFFQEMLDKAQKTFMNSQNEFSLLNFKTEKWHYIINIQLLSDN